MSDPNQARDVYFAVSDPTRRKLIRLLADAEELPLHELTAQFQMGRTAVSKHLAVLKDAQLVVDRKVGRETRYRVNPIPLREIQDWVSYYEQFWTNQMVALQRFLEEEQNVRKDVSLDFEFKNAIEKVWTALTDARTLAKWMIFKENNFKPLVGHKFQFRTEPNQWWDGIVHCEVLEVEAPHRLAYTWVSGGEETTVTWTLIQVDDRTTHVHLDQTGFKADQAFSGAMYGWQSMASELERVLAN